MQSSSRGGLLRRHSSAITFAIRVLDAAACLGGGLLAYRLRFSGWAMPASTIPLLTIGVLLAMLLFPAFGVYQSWRGQGGLAAAGRAIGVWCATFAMLLVLLVLYKRAEHFSRLWLGLWFLLTLFSLAFIRIAGYGVLRALRRHGRNSRTLVIVGDGPQARGLVRDVTATAELGLRVSAVFGNGGPQHAGARDPDYIDALKQHLASAPVDEIWVALPLERSAELRQVLDAARDSLANIRYVPDLTGLFLLNQGVSEILGIPMLDLSASPMQGVNRIIKKLEDWVLGTVILILASPIMLLIAIGIKLSSPGPVFYRQERVGWNGRTFQMLKFRSMPVNAESTGGAIWARKNDNRATRFGKFIRGTSLDELPQFINVLKGNMSIVGPRPERPAFVEQFKRHVPGYMQKHMVKAGITGWAQINGWRGQTELVRRIQHDLYYIEHWSLWFDLKIIFLTPFRGFVNENAY